MILFERVRKCHVMPNCWKRGQKNFLSRRTTLRFFSFLFRYSTLLSTIESLSLLLKIAQIPACRALINRLVFSIEQRTDQLNKLVQLSSVYSMHNASSQPRRDGTMDDDFLSFRSALSSYEHLLTLTSWGLFFRQIVCAVFLCLRLCLSLRSVWTNAMIPFDRSVFLLVGGRGIQRSGTKEFQMRLVFFFLWTRRNRSVNRSVDKMPTTENDLRHRWGFEFDWRKSTKTRFSSSSFRWTNIFLRFLQWPTNGVRATQADGDALPPEQWTDFLRHDLILPDSDLSDAAVRMCHISLPIPIRSSLNNSFISPHSTNQRARRNTTANERTLIKILSFSDRSIRRRLARKRSRERERKSELRVYHVGSVEWIDFYCQSSKQKVVVFFCETMMKTHNEDQRERERETSSCHCLILVSFAD